MFGYVDATALPKLLRIMVDPAAIFRWRQQPWRKQLESIAKMGLEGRPEEFHTVACIGKRNWLIYPGGDHEITGKAYVVTEMEHIWEVRTFPSISEARDFQRGHLHSR